MELILKSPTDRIVPFPIKCETIWTVKELKLNITSVYPGKPTVESQKIIYAGKLLKDDQILKDLFEFDSTNIVHFICQPSVNGADKEVKIQNSEMEITPEKYIELYKEYQMYINNFYSSASQSFSAMSQYQQMMWINQVYMHSYASYYAQFGVKPETNAAIAGSSTIEVVQQSVTSDIPAQNQENAPNNERRIEGAPENGMQNMMAAAFGGLMGDGGEEENEGEAEPRDLLHYFYMLVRFGLLLLICYYYSSVASVVTTLMLFFVFFGVNILRRNNGRQPPVLVREAEVPLQLPQQPQELQQPQQQLQVTEDQVEEITTENVSEAQSEVTLLQPDIPTITERLRRAASTSFQFVFTFFVTLFPEPIAHVDIN